MEDVMILIPTNSDKTYCIGKFLKNLSGIDMNNKDNVLFSDDTYKSNEYMDEIKSQGYEVIKVTKTIDDLKAGKKLGIVECLANTRNALRDEFLKRKKYKYVMWFDSDIIMPKETIPQLISCNKDIVSGIYWQQKPSNDGKFINEVPVIYKYQDVESYDMNIHKYGAIIPLSELFPCRLLGNDSDLKIVAIGTGCFLASRELMEDNRWKFRYNPERPDTTEDMWFSLDVRGLGYEIYGDSHVCCRHLPRGWKNRIKTMENQK